MANTCAQANTSGHRQLCDKGLDILASSLCQHIYLPQADLLKNLKFQHQLAIEHLLQCFQLEELQTRGRYQEICITLCS